MVVNQGRYLLIKENMEKNRLINWEDLLFFEYKPLHNLVWKNKDKINWILNQDFYLNWWMEKYELIDDEENNILSIEKKDFFNIEELEKEAFLKYRKDIYNNYYIDNLENNTEYNWLWVILINSLKRKLNKWNSIELFDCSKKKNWDKLKDYYKKQGFKWFFWNKKYIK